MCHPTIFEPWFGVELDDSSHQRPDRKDRDALVDEIFAAAGLPLVRVPARSSYAIADLERQLRDATGFPAGRLASTVPAEDEIVRTPAAAVTNSPQIGKPARLSSELAGIPQCPKCGTPMLVRTARTGEKAGNSSWGCSNFPRCQSILPMPLS